MRQPNARPLRRYLMRAFLIVSALALVPSCGDNRPQLAHPPLADLASEAEPQLDAAAVLKDSAAALDDYDSAHASWGRRGWDQVARVRAWFCDAGILEAC